MFSGALAACGLLLVPLGASANIISFDLSYTGVNNSASGIGFISFDDTVLPNTAGSWGNVSPATLGITDFSITISGASSGNGTFGLADFAADPDGWVWNLVGPLDLSLGSELVGQANLSDFNWCAGTQSCGNPLAPGGVSPFTIATSGETGNALVLSSMVVTAVPVPAAVWLFGSALAGLGWMRRKA